MEVSNVKQVRLAKIVEAGGKPEAYLAFSDPDKDVKEKYATYLIFPKRLREFSGQRVIGIDYSILQSADVRIGGKMPPPRKKAEAKKEKARLAAIPKPEPPKPTRKPEPKPEKPKPQPKRFTVEVQITTVDRKEVAVSAWNQAEAKKHAIREIERTADFDKGQMTAKAVKVRAES
jgi:outer membrane biosynthesis protein TonB